MSTDLLDGGRPKRLIFRKGRWFLEMMRLVSTGEGVFQPRSTRIEGRLAIIEALRRSKNGKGLVDSAAKLVSNAALSDDASFEAVDGVWVPSRLVPSYIEQLGRSEVRTPVEAALIADLTMLRASHEGLMARVARLEQLLARDRDGSIHPIAARPARRRLDAPHAATVREPPLSTAEHDAPDEAGAHGDAAESSHSDEDAEHDAGEHDDPAHSEPAEHDGEELPDGKLRFPALGLVTDALKQLCGQDIPLKEMKDAPDSWLETPARFMASWFADEAGEVQAGVLYDFEAVARLGGAYLAMSQADIESQAAAEQPSEDVTSAASDICNTFAGLMNDVRGNPTVRASPLAAFTDAPPLWIDTPGTRLVCLHPGGGTVAFLAR